MSRKAKLYINNEYTKQQVRSNVPLLTLMSKSRQNSYVPDKKKYLSLQLCLLNLFKLHTGRQKMTFWYTVHFDEFKSKVRPQCQPGTPAPSAWFCCCFRPHKIERSPDVLWSAFRRCTSQKSNQLPVLGHTECGGGVGWVHSLALSK